MNLDMSMLLKGQEDPVEDSSTPKNFSKNPNKNMASQSNRKAKRQTCLDSKLICCITTKTVAQPPLALTLHLFPTELMSLDIPDSSFQVSQSQLRLTKQCVFMVSPMTCMEVGTCTISLSISETLDHLVLFNVPTKRGKSSLATTTSSVTCYCFHFISLYVCVRHHKNNQNLHFGTHFHSCVNY